MRKVNFLFVLLTFGTLLNMSSQTKHSHGKSMENKFTKEQKKVYRTVEKMVNAFEKKDIEGVLATYEENAIVMFEPQKPVQGKEALRAVFTQFVGMNPKYTFYGHEVYISGDIATHIAPWHMVGNLPDGSKVEQKGLSVAILRKQPNGKWLMIQDNPHGQFLLD